MKYLDITQDKEAIAAINAVLNGKGICEVKREYNGEGQYSIVVVEIRRQVLTSKR